jgi:anti-anti-sigma regulatory factor
VAGSEIEAAWQEAITLTADVDTLNKVFNLIEQVSVREFSTALNDEPTRARLTETLQLIRGELLHISVAHETVKVGYLDTILHTNNEISTNILLNVNADAPKLDWLRHTPAQWGCLGLWTDPDPDRLNELTLASLYVSHVQEQSSPGDRVAPAVFPPLDRLRAMAREESDIITLLPLHTSKRNWGILAMDGLINTSVTWNSDPIVMWSRMLGAALDRAALLAELNAQQEELRQQREILQIAYDRERALAITIRELGCPIIPLMPGVILIPLIGGIDSERAQQIIKLGLEAVGRERATEVLIDLTGVPLVDTQVAGALIQMARMLGLLGARTMLVGIRPEIAQSIVGLGIDLAQIVACSSLAEAIRLLRVRGPVMRET